MKTFIFVKTFLNTDEKSPQLEKDTLIKQSVVKIDFLALEDAINKPPLTT